MKKLFTFLIISVAFTGFIQAQSKDEKDVRQLLTEQDAAWNRGDIEGFMKGYWLSDSLMFIGKSGITYGWQKTMENYKNRYPDTAAMGKLNFEYIEMKQLSENYFFVVGKWYLTRTIGNLNGAFTLLLRKINNSAVGLA